MRHSTPLPSLFCLSSQSGVILSEIAHRRNLKVVVEERIDLQME